MRDQTGEGQHVETSLYDSSLHLITHYIADYTGSGRLPGKLGGGFAFLAPYGMFQARDREFYIGVGTDAMFAKLCEALGAPALAERPALRRATRRASRTARSSTASSRRSSPRARRPTGSRSAASWASPRASSTNSPRWSSRSRRWPAR